MKILIVLLLVVINLSFVGCVSAQTNKSQSNKKTESPINKPMIDKQAGKTTGDDIKIIAEDTYSNVETPFVFVARDRETYAQLKTLVENLPSAETIDFSRLAVVAAFAGEKRTGGYSAAIRRTAVDKYAIEVVEPPKDAMTTDALTYPMQVALVPIEEEKTLSLEVSKNWREAMRVYKIASSEFESSSGSANRRKQFKAEGTVGVLTFGDYATLAFNLSGTGANKNKKLTEIASGALKDGAINLERLDAGSFSDNPKSPLKVSGRMSGDKLNLVFEPLPTRVADGFQTGGKLEAVKINR